MPLCIGHGAAIKPDVDQVRNALHGFARRTHQDDIVDIRFVQVKNAFMEIIFVNIGTQSLIGFANTVIQLFDGADADLFLAIFSFPDR